MINRQEKISLIMMQTHEERKDHNLYWLEKEIGK